jgi:hypothetical protein
LDWTWVRGKRVMGSGQIRRDGFESDAQLHALQLLDVAEAGRRSACPTTESAPPLKSVKSDGLGEEFLRDFQKAHTRWIDGGGCGRRQGR